MHRSVRLVIGSVAAVLLGAAATFGQDGSGADRTPSAQPRAAAGRSAYCPAIDLPAALPNRRVFVDPVTGLRREPTPEEAAQLEAAVRAARAARAKALSELEVVVHPDGSKSIDLKDTFMTDLVARRDPSGSVTVECQPPGQRLAAAPAAPPPAAPAPAPRLEEK